MSEAGGEFVEEYRVSLPGGGQRWINARGRARSEVSGPPRFVTGISLDITARRETRRRSRRRTPTCGACVINSSAKTPT